MAERANARVPGPSDSVKVLFIGGSGRSGSTVVERLLGALPGVCNVGEVVLMWERGLLRGERCGCGVPLPQCPFWCEVGDVAFGGWNAFNVPEFLALKRSVDRHRFIPRLLAAVAPAAACSPRRPPAAPPGSTRLSTRNCTEQSGRSAAARW